MKLVHNQKLFCFIIFAAGIILGTIITNRVGANYIQEMSMFSYASEHQLTSDAVDSSQLAWYIVKQRLPMILFIWVMFMSMFGNLVFYGYLFYFSFTMGAVLSMETLIYGMKSVLIFLGSAFPHYLFYLAGLFVLYQRGVPVSKEWYNDSGSGKKRDSKAIFKRHVMTLVMVLAIYMAGILLEAYLSPIILEKLL